MSNTPKSRQGRQRVQEKRSLLPFYLLLGLTGIVGLTFVFIQALQTPVAPPSASIPVRPNIKAAVGQTSEGYWYKGDPKAPVKIIEFADFECPGCRQLEVDLANANFDAEYIETGKVQWIYREFPLRSIHKSAQYTAEVSRCAGDQNVYWPVHMALYDSQIQWTNLDNPNPLILDAAVQAGADLDTLEDCMDAETHKATIDASYDSAKSLGLDQTPTVFINDDRITFVGNYYTDIKTAIDAKLGVTP
ncbi:DsbA family protein [Herpetosiphon llansteffanensis]|uniref:DsbA family protein n=1 Tax=Herpetosiphon llansteffanensis TaxID=2094568 RepID=UPI000D7D1E88|nr:thioredoxin domain-containing protein [Herpetosiphon llansteffanensis]